MSNVDDLKSTLAEIINEPIVTHFIASVEYISEGGAREVLTFSDSELMSWEALGMVDGQASDRGRHDGPDAV